MAVRILEDQVVNQIAAGEVVERPASVVKELVENALDAGARTVGIHLSGGGASRVRVIDDGSGMDRADAMTCIERHATSKILRAEDLLSILTLGFRGEALPSIAAVSRFRMVTRRPDDDVGTTIRIDGGRLLDVSDVGCPVGTEVDVRTLFYNLPARRKFLRTAATELSHAVESVSRTALAHPHVDFLVTAEGRDVLHLPSHPDRATRARALIGQDGRTLLHTNFLVPGGNAEGLISPVGVHRSTAAGATWLQVNGRPVRDAVVRHALLEAYRDIVPKGRYPVVALWLDLAPDHVDVNVHPAKTEIRFRDPRDVQDAVIVGLRQALQQHGIRIPAPGNNPPPWRPQATLPLRPTLPIQSQTEAPPPPSMAASPVHAEPFQPRLAAPGAPLLPVPRFRDLEVIGQFANTYLLCQGRGELVLVDQHAAHERVRLHQLQAGAHTGGRQRLLTPLRVDLGAARQAVLERSGDTLSELGLDTTTVAPGVIAVTAVPVLLEKADLANLLTDLADEISAGGARSGNDIIHRLLATVACHSAVRAGQPLSAWEMKSLLASLDEVDFEVCAHGRPVAIRIGLAELERRFHRT